MCVGRRPVKVFLNVLRNFFVFLLFKMFSFTFCDYNSLFSFFLSSLQTIPYSSPCCVSNSCLFSLIAVKYIYVYVDTNIFINIVCSVCMMLLVCMFSVLNIWYLITIGVLFLSWGKPILSTFSTVLIHFLFHPPCFGLIQYKQLICWLSNKKKVVNLSIG